MTSTATDVVKIAALKEGRRPRVLIVGGGFAGTRAVQGLADLPVDVTLVDRRNHFTFQPLLYQVALAVLSPADIAAPTRSMFRRAKNVEVLMDEVIGFDIAKRQAFFRSRAAMEYDYLMVATGATHSYFGNDHWAEAAPGLKTIENAIEIRRRVLLAFELAERQMLETGSHPPLNFVVVGAGPTGVELAGAISDISKLYMKHDFRHIDPAKARVLLIEGGPRVLPVYPEELSQKAAEQLTALGVEIHTDRRVSDIQPGFVMLDGTERIDTVVTLWAAGVAVSPLGKMMGLPTDRRGAVLVNDTLNPEGHPEVFVCGDLAHFEQDGKQVPGIAQPAMQMGRHVAGMIAADLAGKRRKFFRYFDKGDMATIGRRAAVAKLQWPFKLNVSGFPAWFMWIVVHVYFLVGFRSRIVVMMQWFWQYFTFTRGARLIYGDQELVGWMQQPGVEAPDDAAPLDINSPHVSGQPAESPTRSKEMVAS